MISSLKLPLYFDVAPIKRDLAQFENSVWTPHFNTGYYEGDWSGIALRTTPNAHVPLFPDPAAETFVDTDEMLRFPSVSDVLRKFECETESVRFLRLTPGSQIREHRDIGLRMEEGSARIHIPVQTSQNVEFLLDKLPLEMSEGEAWYINFDLPHSVINRGTDARIHLVVDCVVNDWLRSFFPQF